MADKYIDGKVQRENITDYFGNVLNVGDVVACGYKGRYKNMKVGVITEIKFNEAKQWYTKIRIQKPEDERKPSYIDYEQERMVILDDNTLDKKWTKYANKVRKEISNG